MIIRKSCVWLLGALLGLTLTGVARGAGPAWLERAGYLGDPKSHLAFTTFTTQPAAGQVVTQPESGVKIRRITDFDAITKMFGPKYDEILAPRLVRSQGKPFYGWINGYSRYPCVNLTGEYAFAYGTEPIAVLIRLADFKPLGLVQGATPKAHPVGSLQELKWGDDPAKPYYAGYVTSSTYNMQDVVANASFSHLPLPREETFGNFGLKARNTEDGNRDVGGPQVAEKVQLDKKNAGVRVLKDGKLLPFTVRQKNISSADISPSGKFLFVNATFYDLPSGKIRNEMKRAGHGGWAIDRFGREWYVHQNNANDWVEAFDPQTSNVMQLVHLKELGWWNGLHVASDKRGVAKGWALLSFYGTTPPFQNSLFFIELKGQRENMPAEMRPRMARVCSMQNYHLEHQIKYKGHDGTTHTEMKGYYFTEGFASINPDQNIYWGGNWNGTDNLELYRAEMPAEMKKILGMPELKKRGD